MFQLNRAKVFKKSKGTLRAGINSEGGCTSKIGISTKAVEQLREQLLQKFFELGFGFRINVSANEAGEPTFSIRIDRQHQGDKVLESDGIRIFLDSPSAAQISGYQLDYEDEPGGGFFLSTMK